MTPEWNCEEFGYEPDHHVSQGEISAMFHKTILLVKVHARMSDQHVLREKRRMEE